MFKPSIALLLDFSMAPLYASGAAHHLQSRDQLAQAWIRIADASSSYGHISDAFSDVNKLQAMVKIQPLEICDRDLTETPEAHRPMYEFVQLLEAESTGCIEAAAKTALEKIGLPEGAKRAGLAKRLQLLTDTGPTTKAQMIELNGYRDQFVVHFSAREQHQQQQQQKLVKSRLTVLKSSILLLKLASLVVNIKSQSSTFLCQIVRSVTALLSRSLQKATVSTSDKQEHQLAVHAVELVIPLLKHYVRQREGVASTVTLFQFLECVLDKEPNSTVQALLAQLLASGTALRPWDAVLSACTNDTPSVCSCT